MPKYKGEGGVVWEIDAPSESQMDQIKKGLLIPLDAEPEAEESESEGYEGKTVVQLKDELAKRDLATSGNKAELIGRLEADDAKES